MKKVLFIIILVFSFMLQVNAEELNGWVYENNNTYYYENGIPVIGYKTIDNERYFFKDTGVLQNNIVFLGDSEIEIYDLNKYYPNYPVINSGVSGNTTRDILNNIHNRLYVYNPSKVIILIGTNDTYFGIEKEETITNINKIINEIKTNLPNTKIYLESIYPCNNSDNPKINHEMVGNRTNEFLSSINNQIKDIDGVTYINVYDHLILNGLLNINYTYDGLHPNSTGYDVITGVLKPYVEEDDSSSNIKDKWYYKNNNIYYYENGELVKGYKTINGKEYYFDEETGEKTILVDSIEFNPKEITIEKEDTEKLQLNIFPSNAKTMDITWTSSNEEIATVDQNGVVTAINEGNVTITATTFNNKTAECNVTVIKRYPKIKYKTHVQTYGWQDYVKSGNISGTTGQAKRLEGIKIKLEDVPYEGSVEYKSHIQTYGWENEFKKDDEFSGTEGEAKRLEAIEIKLTGEVSNYYDIYYRVHVQKLGWLGWAKNGESAGSAGYAYRLEAIEILFLEKGKTPADYESNTKAFIQKKIGYRTHVQTYGWQDYAYDGEMAGTTGEAKRLEAIEIVLSNQEYSGDVIYRTHIQSYGWVKYLKNGGSSGTFGEAKRLEAIEIELTGEMAEHYDIYYRVHAQSYGWLAWAKNGESAGTAGLAKRLEGIEIILVDKGESPPIRENQNNNKSFIENS